MRQSAGRRPPAPPRQRPRRRSFSPAEKLRLLAGYETATESGTGNAFLRENGLYSSLISEWRRTRDAGLLTGKQAGAVVAEDVSVLRHQFARWLTRLGYRVHLAEDGLDALDLVHQVGEEASILVTDGQMPRMTGKELLQALGCPRPGLGTVLVSGEQVDGWMSLADRFLLKPFTAPALREAVQDALAAAARRASLAASETDGRGTPPDAAHS